MSSQLNIQTSNQNQIGLRTKLPHVNDVKKKHQKRAKGKEGNLEDITLHVI